MAERLASLGNGHFAIQRGLELPVSTRASAVDIAAPRPGILPDVLGELGLELVFGPLADNPHLVGAPLRAPFNGQWRARRGEYRGRYRIDDKEHIVYVLNIDHRLDAYRS